MFRTDWRPGVPQAVEPVVVVTDRVKAKGGNHHLVSIREALTPR